MRRQISNIKNEKELTVCLLETFKRLEGIAKQFMSVHLKIILSGQILIKNKLTTYDY